MPFVFAAAVVAATAVFAWAWRGRRTDEHPCCRGCGFDLVGSGAFPTQCPECGRGLIRHRAVRVGNRERRYRVLTASGVLLVGLATLGGITAWRAGSHASLMGMLPESVLRLIYPSDPLARVELVKRLNDNNLGAGTVSAVIASALDIQGDTSKPWDPNWGRFIEAASTRGVLSAADGERYLKQAITFTLNVGPEVRMGRTPRMHGRFELRRSGDLPVRVTAHWEKISIDGQSLPPDSYQWSPEAHWIKPYGSAKPRYTVAIDPLGKTLGRFTVSASVWLKIELDGQSGSSANPIAVSGIKLTASQAVEVIDALDYSPLRWWNGFRPAVGPWPEDFDFTLKTDVDYGETSPDRRNHGLDEAGINDLPRDTQAFGLGYFDRPPPPPSDAIPSMAPTLDAPTTAP